MYECLKYYPAISLTGAPVVLSVLGMSCGSSVAAVPTIIGLRRGCRAMLLGSTAGQLTTLFSRPRAGHAFPKGRGSS